MSEQPSALASALPGRTYQLDEPYEIGREKIREFADAIGDPNPAFRDPTAARSLGYEDVIAPPTFATVVTMRALRQLLADPELSIDLSRVVHGDQRFIATRPLRAGDLLNCDIVVEKVRSLGGSLMVTTKSEITRVKRATGRHAAATTSDGITFPAEQGASPLITAYATLLIRDEVTE